MAYSGINFRLTDTYVTDGSGYTYCLPTDAAGTTRGGLTFGFGSTSGTDGRNRSTGLDTRIAGMHFAPAATRSFRLVLPSGAGTYNVRILSGDNDAGWSHQIVIKDGVGGTTLATISGTTATARWMDIAGTTTITAANVASDAFASSSLTFSNTTAEFLLGDNTNNPHTTIAHIAVEFVSGGGSTVPLQLISPKQGIFLASSHGR